MTDFEKALKTATEQGLLKMVRENNLVMPDYNNRVKIPADFMNDIWNLVDIDRVKKEMAKLLEKELANKLINRIAAEISTDIKQVLSVQERREEIRAVVRENIDRICKS